MEAQLRGSGSQTPTMLFRWKCWLPCTTRIRRTVQGRNIPIYGSAVECDETAQRENGAPRHPERVQVLINTQKPLLQFLSLQLEMSPYGNISK